MYIVSTSCFVKSAGAFIEWFFVFDFPPPVIKKSCERVLLKIKIAGVNFKN